MGIAGRLKKERRTLRNNLKEVAEAPIFYFASDTGAAVFREQNVSGRPMNVTYGFTSHGEAKTRAVEYEAEWGGEVHVRNMPVGTFLAFLFHHLDQADIDIVLSDGEKPYPLTTMGVNALQDPLWAELLEKSRDNPSKNVLLTKVARDLLTSAGGPGAHMVVNAADYDTILRAITNQKRTALPTVDLGLVWFLTQQVQGTDEVEPVILKITSKDDSDLHDQVEELGSSAIAEGEDIIVGPLSFSSRDAALDWGSVLPPHVAVHLFGLKLMLTAERGVQFLGEIRDQFPAYRVPDLAPDCFVFDGGVLPLTLDGAGYVESKISYAETPLGEQPERNWVTVAQGQFTKDGGGDGVAQCRNMALSVVARELNITIVDPDAEDESESCLVSLAEDDGLLESAVANFMAMEPSP
jgi:hypothetical protein